MNNGLYYKSNIIIDNLIFLFIQIKIEISHETRIWGLVYRIKM